MAPDANAVVVASSGVLPVLGRSVGPHLEKGGALRALLSSGASRTGDGRRLWRDPDGHWHRVQLVRCRDGALLVTEERIEVPHGLTPRELDVLHLMTTGASNREIANQLIVSVRTVGTHVEHILRKLNVSTRTEGAARAAREGLARWSEPGVPASGQTLSAVGLRPARRARRARTR